MSLMKDTFIFVVNKCGYQQRRDGSFYNLNNENEAYNFFEPLIKMIRQNLNILNISDILKKEGEFSYHNDTLEHEAINDFFCNKEKITQEIDENYFSLLLFNYFLGVKSIYGTEFSKIINEYNKNIAKYNLSYSNKEFDNLSPIIQTDFVNKILNFPKEIQGKYIDIEREYSEAFEEYNKGQYKEAIWKSFVALESMVKQKLTEKNIIFNESDNFTYNIDKMKENNLFKGFLIKENLVSLSSIRNHHGGHGSSSIHVEDKDFTYFYLYNIGNTLIYISKI